MTFRFSGILLRYVGYQQRLSYDSPTVGDALDELLSAHPSLRDVLLTPEGAIRRTHRLALNDEVVPSDLTRELGATDVVEVMTAVAGG
ncbi:sulfur carrier protein ThiS [Allocatelliglobosispora scoriae]|uniref:Sulfur carrier protein ThiS n=1 Tax=Allocatelliglobosispora scoriae TaxID=643052 RepID=A0A841BIX9_9ACTN|nr:MoaD/ThiS family protein [Allocatelliglobosispora scoriae]MBB5866732.1 sulfur carrier protein ThiS [Allocatelliglobosispora scoriae]